VSSLKTQQRICPVVIRLKPNTQLPSQNDLSRDDLIDGLTQQLRTVFDAIPAHAGPIIVEDDAGLGHTESRVVSSRKFVIEAHEVGPCNTELRDAIEPSVLETMKVLLGVFGMEPASINVTEE